MKRTKHYTNCRCRIASTRGAYHPNTCLLQVTCTLGVCPRAVWQQAGLAWAYHDRSDLPAKSIATSHCCPDRAFACVGSLSSLGFVHRHHNLLSQSCWLMMSPACQASQADSLLESPGQCHSNSYAALHMIAAQLTPGISCTSSQYTLDEHMSKYSCQVTNDGWTCARLRCTERNCKGCRKGKSAVETYMAVMQSCLGWFPNKTS